MYAQAALNTHMGSAAGVPPPLKRRKCDIDSDEENDWEWERLDAAFPEYAKAMIAAQCRACDHLPRALQEHARTLGVKGPPQRITLPSALQARARMLLERGAPQQITLVVAIASGSIVCAAVLHRVPGGHRLQAARSLLASVSAATARDQEL